jgi:hypothetical protein
MLQAQLQMIIKYLKRLELPTTNSTFISFIESIMQYKINLCVYRKKMIIKIM